MIYVTDAQYAGDYKVQVRFSDHLRGVIDLKDTVLRDHRPIVRELEDKEKFKCLRVELDTVVWENGLDLAPEFLYQKLKDTNAGDEFFSKMNS